MLAITKSWFWARSSKIGVVTAGSNSTFSTNVPSTLSPRVSNTSWRPRWCSCVHPLSLIGPMYAKPRRNLSRPPPLRRRGRRARTGGRGPGRRRARRVAGCSSSSSSSPQAASTLPPRKTPAAPAAPIWMRRLLPMPIVGSTDRGGCRRSFMGPPQIITGLLGRPGRANGSCRRRPRSPNPGSDAVSAQLSSWAIRSSTSADHSRRQRRFVGSSTHEPSMPLSMNCRKSSGPKPMWSAATM